MLKLFRKKKTEGEPQGDSPTPLTWDTQATQGLEQAMQQAPIPALLKKRVRQELCEAAESTARADGRSIVTAQDLMQGLLGKLPANMRQKVETAVQGGPEKLKELEKDLKNYK